MPANDELMKEGITVLAGAGHFIGSLVYTKTVTLLINVQALDMKSVGASSHDVITIMETKTEPSNSNKQPNSQTAKQPNSQTKIFFFVSVAQLSCN